MTPRDFARFDCFSIGATSPTPIAPESPIVHWFYNSNWPIYAASAAGIGLGAWIGGPDHRIAGGIIGGLAVPILGAVAIVALWANH